MFRCSLLPHGIAPYGVYLKRCWRRPSEVLFMHKGNKPSVSDSHDVQRIGVSGDPSDWQVNVTISELRSTDTDRYCCEFLVADDLNDRSIPGKVEYFLHVAYDAPSTMDVVHVDTYAGGLAVLQCARPPERLSFTPVPAVGGMAFNLTLRDLQPRDTGFYSCTLLLAGRSQAISSLGSQVTYVSVQGGHCNCSIYTTLLYGLSAAVAATLLLIVAVIYRAKASTRVKPQTHAIYEEMVGVQGPKPKLNPCGLGTFQLEEVEASAYSNTLVVKPRAENHYESPRLAKGTQG
ncbi:hypothetical protein NHX12_018301 [Muraenolepis orangiensis]|uniref:Ig-like domain-containing protein n=1 Tax=Muraenolepis orangiensis TaxID=630683 RepID=A0A9Q0EWK9_9TELE|nr:hypothetical protein NHX12_018301 [Muraenolepis orangiensis]